MLPTNVIFSKIEQKNKVETIYVSFFQQKSTNEMLKSYKIDEWAAWQWANVKINK
jgi:hypothetical protein